MYKSAEKSKIKDLNSPSNEQLIVLDWWSKKIEEYYIYVTLTILTFLKNYNKVCDKYNEQHGEACQLYGTRHDWTSREFHWIGEW